MFWVFGNLTLNLIVVAASQNPSTRVSLVFSSCENHLLGFCGQISSDLWLFYMY
jgi:hypothetical protein